MNKIHKILVSGVKYYVTELNIVNDRPKSYKCNHVKLETLSKIVHKSRVFNTSDKIHNAHFFIYYVLDKDLDDFNKKLKEYFEKLLDTLEYTICSLEVKEHE